MAVATSGIAFHASPQLSQSLMPYPLHSCPSMSRSSQSRDHLTSAVAPGLRPTLYYIVYVTNFVTTKRLRLRARFARVGGDQSVHHELNIAVGNLIPVRR